MQVTGAFMSDAQTGWLRLLNSAGGAAPFSLGQRNIVLGGVTGNAANAHIHGLWVLPAVLEVDAVPVAGSSPSMAQVLVAITAQAGAPAIITITKKSQGDGVVNTELQFAVTAETPANSTRLLMRVTLSGATPADCLSSSCGDVVYVFSATGSAVQGVFTGLYKRAGRCDQLKTSCYCSFDTLQDCTMRAAQKADWRMPGRGSLVLLD